LFPGAIGGSLDIRAAAQENTLAVSSEAGNSTVRARVVSVGIVAGAILLSIEIADRLIEAAEFSLSVKLLDDFSWESGVGLSWSSVLILLELLFFVTVGPLTLVLLISLRIASRMLRLLIKLPANQPANQKELAKAMAIQTRVVAPAILLAIDPEYKLLISA
jgi:hypothetical protein